MTIKSRFTSASLMAALIAAILLTSAATIVSQRAELTVHEWGTFTTVSRADGKAQIWRPLSGPSELPGFVYRSRQVQEEDQCSKCSWALARMETPVLYFYSDREMNVSVKIGFPRGKITEWYPQSRAVNPGIIWDNLTVLPGAQATFPVDQRKSHYYPARETDASPIRVGSEPQAEYEKFLFYRGIGDFELPLTAGLTGDQLRMSNSWQDEIAQVFVFENRDGQIGWNAHGPFKGRLSLARPKLGQQNVESLHHELEATLISQGLFAKEARAMVRTWQDSWFEEGLRVFYIVPRKTTDEILPITITPAPANLSRVLVGRAEIITPEMEEAIAAAVKLFDEGSDESRAAAIKMVRKYGRFAGPVLTQMRSNTSNRTLQTNIFNLMNTAMKK